MKKKYWSLKKMNNDPTFVTAKDLPKYEPAFTVGSFRHLQHIKSKELIALGVVVYLGSKLLINLAKFREYIASGKARKIGHKKES